MLFSEHSSLWEHNSAATHQHEGLTFFLFFLSKACIPFILHLNVSLSYPPLKSSFWYDHAEIPGKHVQATTSRSAQPARVSIIFLTTIITITLLLLIGSSRSSAVSYPHTGAGQRLTAAPSPAERLFTRRRADPPTATKHWALATVSWRRRTSPPANFRTRRRRRGVCLCRLWRSQVWFLFRVCLAWSRKYQVKRAQI